MVGLCFQLLSLFLFLLHMRECLFDLTPGYELSRCRLQRRIWENLCVCPYVDICLELGVFLLHVIFFMLFLPAWEICARPNGKLGSVRRAAAGVWLQYFSRGLELKLEQIWVLWCHFKRQTIVFFASQTKNTIMFFSQHFPLFNISLFDFSLA